MGGRNTEGYPDPTANTAVERVAKEEKKKKTEQKDELMENDRRYPVEQVSNTGEPTKKEVKAAVKELNPDLNSLGSRG